MHGGGNKKWDSQLASTIKGQSMWAYHPDRVWGEEVYLCVQGLVFNMQRPSCDEDLDMLKTIQEDKPNGSSVEQKGTMNSLQLLNALNAKKVAWMTWNGSIFIELQLKSTPIKNNYRCFLINEDALQPYLITINKCSFIWNCI